MHDLWQHWGPLSPEAIRLARIALRLVIAAFLGGAIGLEREMKRKPAGLRTNMFICFGAAMFTILSEELASQWTGDHTRIAAQIIPGIGFIGAGSILHSRGSVTGLTTAATLFVVAGIGMAAGGGLYVPAIFATIMILLALNVLGYMEAKFSLKQLQMAYEVSGEDPSAVIDGINLALADQHKMMQTVQVARVDHHSRVQFTVDATRVEHERLLSRLRQIPVARHVECLGAAESE
jgi:putative Mg2+ transporter-C (MgtC) family protein